MVLRNPGFLKRIILRHGDPKASFWYFKLGRQCTFLGIGALQNFTCVLCYRKKSRRMIYIWACRNDFQKRYYFKRSSIVKYLIISITAALMTLAMTFMEVKYPGFWWIAFTSVRSYIVTIMTVLTVPIVIIDGDVATTYCNDSCTMFWSAACKPIDSDTR